MTYKKFTLKDVPPQVLCKNPQPEVEGFDTIGKLSWQIVLDVHRKMHEDDEK